MYNSTIANATPVTPAAVRARLCVMLAHASSDWIFTSASGRGSAGAVRRAGLRSLDCHLHLVMVVVRRGAVRVEADADFDDARVGRGRRIDAEDVRLVDDRADPLHVPRERLRERAAGNRRLLAGAHEAHVGL